MVYSFNVTAHVTFPSSMIDVLHCDLPDLKTKLGKGPSYTKHYFFRPNIGALKHLALFLALGISYEYQNI